MHPDTQTDCQHLSDPASQPELEVIAYDYYDGATSGTLTCNRCGVSYRLQMLDWDDWQRVRIFSLAPLDRSHYERFRDLRLEHRTDWSEVSDELGRILEASGPIRWVIALDSFGDRLIASRRVAQDELTRLDWTAYHDTPPAHDWFSFVGLHKRTVSAGEAPL